MGRLESTFAQLRQTGAPGLVAYVTAGDPDARTSEEILVALAEGGADVIEVGVPFSDPLADGPVIQRASERALAGGMNLRGALALVAKVRARIATPIVLFT
jgi:tryptophan synthase alpha chain